MAGRKIGIGHQDYEKLIESGCFYIDKTDFIKEWWGSDDQVTLITRPRRFGKTLNMSMLEKFFSVEYANRGDLFSGLSIWKEEEYRKIQGTYPVIFITFADIKEASYQNAMESIASLFGDLYHKFSFLLQSEALEPSEKEFILKVQQERARETELSRVVQRLSGYLQKHYGKKVIILLDEYDTPLQEAYVNGYWEKLTSFLRTLFNSAFKTNPYLERGMMTGITRVSKESIFSDLNHLNVVTTTSEEYETAFGFTEQEVFDSMDEMDIDSGERENVKFWYDGFTFGRVRDIYNPWSIINYLDKKKLQAYWTNTSSNKMIDLLVRQSDGDIKEKFEDLLVGRSIFCHVDEEIVFDQLDLYEDAIWSLLLASGYLRVINVEEDLNGVEEAVYELALTNHEVLKMFSRMVTQWFSASKKAYNEFTKAMLTDDVKSMNQHLNDVTASVVSSFDSGVKPSAKAPERFYHGLVLGMIVDLKGRYVLTSNRESGYGRYDITLEPLEKTDPAIIIEFKVFNGEDEQTLKDTAAAALQQIEDQKYEQTLLDRGITKDRIVKYGFAFRGKEVLIVGA